MNIEKVLTDTRRFKDQRILWGLSNISTKTVYFRWFQRAKLIYMLIHLYWEWIRMIKRVMKTKIIVNWFQYVKQYFIPVIKIKQNNICCFVICNSFVYSKTMLLAPIYKPYMYIILRAEKWIKTIFSQCLYLHVLKAKLEEVMKNNFK